jgi:hypothetical protein
MEEPAAITHRGGGNRNLPVKVHFFRVSVAKRGHNELAALKQAVNYSHPEY